jgi:hypothetical protein
MLSLFLLVFFLIEFLLILGVLVFVLFFARPEVPLSGDGTEETQPAGRPAHAKEPTRSGGAAATLLRHDLHHRNTHLAA